MTIKMCYECKRKISYEEFTKNDGICNLCAMGHEFKNKGGNIEWR